METLETSPTFENISQRVVFSYIRQLTQFAPFFPEHLSPGDQHDMQRSQKELHNFFRAFFKHAYEVPELFGLPIKPDTLMIPGYTKEEKQAVSKQFKKPRVTMEHGIDFLYLVGQQGEVVNEKIHLDNHHFAAFFAKGPRVKRKFLKGMESVGLTISEQDEDVIVSNPQFPNMLLALQALAKACVLYDDTRLGKFIFARCDFRVLNDKYQPDILDFLRSTLSPVSYEGALKIHQNLSELSYVPVLNIGGVHEWRIQYQGNRKIKSTPFFEFEYDERQQSQNMMRVKCASTNRLVPLLSKQSESLQKDFFFHAHNCAGSSCGWCDTRKSLEPSDIEYGDEKRTICWWMQRHFNEYNSEVVNLIKQYALLHEDLLTV